MAHAPIRLTAGFIGLIWQNFVGRKVFTPGKKSAGGVRADEVLILGETISAAYIGGTEGRTCLSLADLKAQRAIALLLIRRVTTENLILILRESTRRGMRQESRDMARCHPGSGRQFEGTSECFLDPSGIRGPRSRQPCVADGGADRGSSDNATGHRHRI